MMLTQGDTSIFTSSWILYVEVVLVVVCGCIWVVRQTQGLGLYDPLVILPLLIGTYILFGGVAGGLYFNEFATLHLGIAGVGNWPIYICGMLAVLVGLGLIATAGISVEEKAEQARSEAATKRWKAVSTHVKVQSAQRQILKHFKAYEHPELCSASRMPAPNSVWRSYRTLLRFDALTELASNTASSVGEAVGGAVSEAERMAERAVGGALEQAKSRRFPS